MDITPYVEMLEERLAAAAAVGDESTRRVGVVARRRPRGWDPPRDHGGAIEFAAEISAVLTDRVVETRLDGSEISAAVSAAPAAEHREDEESAVLESGDTSRVTLRLPDELRSGPARRPRERVSRSTPWLARAVQDALRAAGTRQSRGTRLRGWVEA